MKHGCLGDREGGGDFFWTFLNETPFLAWIKPTEGEGEQNFFLSFEMRTLLFPIHFYIDGGFFLKKIF